MNSDPLLSTLNPEQRAAVVHGDGPLLILAGAGSGKTRVITHRIAWLIERRNVRPWQILAVTFTNKAAGEMRERLERLMGPVGADVQVSTFHATGATLLRREAEKVGLTRSFVIYDDTDQLQLLKRALAELGANDDVKPQVVRHKIDQWKNDRKLPGDLTAPKFDRVGTLAIDAYARYEKLLRAADAVDFGDLLLKPVVLFQNDPATLARYRDRFQYVLVDEFQDTNKVQFDLLRLLCPSNRANLCVVGDDDQSIYGWRGADISNILSFERDFPGTQVVKLEQNYRSDAGILEAAYGVISKNRQRKEKRLWTDRAQGEPIDLFQVRDEKEEARLIAEKIRGLVAEGVPYSEIAVFYRTNAQSRVLEEGMRLGQVAYHIVRGRAFYDRAEIKNAASYLRLGVNPRSDADLERVINVPARGIGATTVERLRRYAQGEGLSLFEALDQATRIPELNAGAQRKLTAFRVLLLELQKALLSAPSAHDGVMAMLATSGLLEAFDGEGTEEGSERAENLREFGGAAEEFDRMREGASDVALDLETGPLKLPQSPVEAFLEQISLLGDADAESGEGRVSLMTLHAAKGLEFDAVFMAGMEEELFPSIRKKAGETLYPVAEDPEAMAEERRLCYVGITRARKRLTFVQAQWRSLFGELKQKFPSRFLGDIPPELFRRRPQPVMAARTPMVREAGEQYLERFEETDGFELDAADGFDEAYDQRAPEERTGGWMGARVRHVSFGEGLVVGSTGKDVMVVRFPSVGEKRIVARFLQRV